jgi:hypothetical protein
MKRYCFLPLVSCVTFGAAQAHAMSIAPIAVPAVSVPVASGCGLGVRRGPFDGCETIYDGNYAGIGQNPYNHYYVGFARGGFCAGRGTHLACNTFGLCRIVCN